MLCKNCQQELDEGVTLCPHCGTENNEPEGAVEMLPEAEIPAQEPEAALPQEPEAALPQEPETPAKLSPGKLALIIAGCVALLALLIALIVGGMSGREDVTESQNPDPTGDTSITEATTPPTTPPDGNPEDVTAKGSYAPEDLTVLENMDAAVAAAAGQSLTNSDLQLYYALIVGQFMSSQDFQYLYYYGIVDFTQPLDTIMCYYDPSLTWQQYFLANALDTWHCYQALASEAQAAGHELSDEYREELAKIPQTLEEDAVANGFANAQEMVETNMGPGVTVESYLKFQETYFLGYSYYEYLCSQIDPTEEEAEAYFEENLALFEENGITRDTKTVDVRHILLTPQGGTTDANNVTTYSEAEWAACLAEAERIRDQWLAGEKTEESFALLAAEYTQDPGSQTTGGLYTDVTVGQMVTTFNDWCFDAARKEGDYGIVQTNYGYHIMYFSGEEYVWMEYAKNTLYNELCNKVVSDAMEKHPLEADYGSMLIYYGNLA